MRAVFQRSFNRQPQSMTTPTRSRLPVGPALTTSFNVVSRNLRPFLLLAAVGYFPSFLLDAVVAPEVPAAVADPAAADAAATAATHVAIGPLLGLFAVTAIVGLFLSASVAYLAITDLRGGRATLREALAGSLAAFPSMLGALALISLMMMGILFVALLVMMGVLMITGDGPAAAWGAIAVPVGVVPAVIVLTTFYVVVPVIVVERIGPVEALRRSEALTKGSRWEVLAFGVCVMSTLAVIGIVMWLFKAAVFGGEPNLAYSLIRYAAFTPQVAFSWTAIAVAYYYLRTADETGAAPSSLTRTT
jgi:hypothetical protein